MAGGVFTFTGWDILLGAGCCSSPESEGSEEEEEDWRSACFLGDTGVEYEYEYEYEFSHPPGSGVLTLYSFSA